MEFPALVSWSWLKMVIISLCSAGANEVRPLLPFEFASFLTRPQGRSESGLERKSWLGVT